jgi:hypothetical protein
LRRVDDLEWLELSVSHARDLLRRLAAGGGAGLNAAELGRSVGLSSIEVKRCVKQLEEAGVVRLLPSLSGRRPWIVLRDCRLLRDLGGTRPDVLRACLTERAAAVLRARDPSTGLFHWESGGAARLDLVARCGGESVGFLVLETRVPRRRQWAPLRIALQKGVIGRGFLLHCGRRSFVTLGAVVVLPLLDFMGEREAWLGCRSFAEAQGMLESRARAAAFDGVPRPWYRAAHP